MGGGIRIPFIVVVAGICGLFADSLLGATLQVQFLCPGCGRVTENKTHCAGHEGTPSRGIRWLDNDIVNLAGTLSAAIVGGALSSFG